MATKKKLSDNVKLFWMTFGLTSFSMLEFCLLYWMIQGSGREFLTNFLRIQATGCYYKVGVGLWCYELVEIIVSTVAIFVAILLIPTLLGFIVVFSKNILKKS